MRTVTARAVPWIRHSALLVRNSTWLVFRTSGIGLIWTFPTFAGVSFDTLDRLGSVQWPCNAAAPAGTPIMHAEVRGISDGDTVSLASRVGKTTLKAVIADRMPVGVCYTTFHHPVTGANVVTTEHSDWATNCPEYKVTAVQVELVTARQNAAAARAAVPVAGA